MRISQLHFFLMLLIFLLEDAPGLCLFAIVQQSTGDFSDVQKAQLGTSLVGSAVFIFLAYRKCVAGKSAQRAAQHATAYDRNVVGGTFSALKNDVKNRNMKAQDTRQAVKKLVAEPSRAKKAKKEYESGKRDVEGVMKVGIV
jgi:hypothetical protein